MSGEGEFATLRYAARDGAAEIVLDRPQVLNAIDPQMIADLDAALDRAEADPQVRAIIVSGAGRAFSAGFDLKASAARGPLDAGQWRNVLSDDLALVMRFWDCPKPTIAAVHGPCIGGAFEIALACDITIAAEDVRMGEPEVRFGSGIVALLLPWIVGAKAAREILLCGQDRIDAARALRLGIVNEVVPPGELMATARARAQDIRAGAEASVRLTKLAINRSYEIMGLRAALDQALEIDILIEATGGPERAEFNRIRATEGLKAALAWREARLGGGAQ